MCVIQLLVDKDTLTNALASSHDTHLLRIDSREDEMRSRVRQWLTTVVDDVHEREELRRNRSRVVEINNLVDHLRDDVDNVELMTHD